MTTDRRGSALLTVLWLTAALAAIGLAVASNVRGESERTATGLDDVKAMFVARGAIERAALHVLWSGQYLTPEGLPMYWRQGQPTLSFSFPTAEVHVDFIPETAKMNVNSAAPKDLYRLLLALGSTDEQSQEITAAIVDWRLPQTPDRQSPFDTFYLSRTPSFLPRHASFLENEELLIVKGVTPELYYGNSLPPGPARPGLRDCLSVFGGYMFDINTVQPAVLLGAGFAPEDVNAIVQFRSQQPIVDGRQLQALQQQLGPLGQRLRYSGNTMYTLRATARLKLPDGKLSDMRRTVAALVKFDLPGNKEKWPVGYEVVRWYDRN